MLILTNFSRNINNIIFDETIISFNTKNQNLKSETEYNNHSLLELTILLPIARINYDKKTIEIHFNSHSRLTAQAISTIPYVINLNFVEIYDKSPSKGFFLIRNIYSVGTI
jgi:hypothetical protein